MQEYIVEAKGIKTRVVEWGDRDKPVILALHGNGHTCYDFIELASLILEDYRFLSVDLPGHGKTECFSNPENYGYPQSAEWLNNVEKALEINNFYLLGHSQGAYIALFYFAKYGESVKKLLLLDGGYVNYQKVIEYNKVTQVLPQQFSVASLEVYRSNTYKKIFESISTLHIDSYEQFIAEEKSSFSRWSELLDEACRESIVEIDGELKFHATAEAMANSYVAICDYLPNIVFSDVFEKNQNKILLLACQYPDSDCYRGIIDTLVLDFKNATAAAIHKLSLSHMMHWENPEMIVEEIRNWFK